MKILEVTNLCKTYGKGDTMVKALDNVSFSVEKGEFVAMRLTTTGFPLILFHNIFSVASSRREVNPFPPAETAVCRGRPASHLQFSAEGR